MDIYYRIGSVKSNIGHTEGCSFLASLIKVSLMLKHKEIIPNIRFNKPNPKIDFNRWLMKVQTEVCSTLLFAFYSSDDLLFFFFSWSKSLQNRQLLMGNGLLPCRLPELADQTRTWFLNHWKR